MEPVREIVARAVPLDRADVDTDQIIPSDWLKRVERTGFGEGLFSEWRERSDFVLNQEQYDGAQILVAGPNFGCGSSREHAPWALEDYGFRAVISPQLRRHLPQQLPEDRAAAGHAARTTSSRAIMRAIEDDPTLEIVVDVVDRRVAVPAIDLDEPFELEDFHHYRLLEGLDDIGITLQPRRRHHRLRAHPPHLAPRSHHDPPSPEAGVTRPGHRRSCDASFVDR